MSKKQQKPDPRIRLIILIVLTIVWAIPDAAVAYGIAVATIIISLLERDTVRQYKAVILISMLILAAFMLLAWLIASNLSITAVLREYMRWVSLVVLSVVLFASMNIIEIVSSLVWLKLPLRLALSLGIALRFLHVIYDEAQRIFTIQKTRGITLSYGAAKKYGFSGLLNRLVSPLLVSVIRRADSLSISITVQQIEKRISEYKYSPFTIYDIIMLFSLFLAVIAILY